MTVYEYIQSLSIEELAVLLDEITRHQAQKTFKQICEKFNLDLQATMIHSPILSASEFKQILLKDISEFQKNGAE